MLKNQKIFITGATGFIGHHLAKELAKENQVTALVRLPRKDNKEKELIAQGIKIASGDLSDASGYAAELAQSDYVFHLAALFKIDSDKEGLYKDNVLGTKLLLDACKDSKVKRFVYFSTAYVSSGRQERDNITEDEPYAQDPRNWYEWSKAEAEKVTLSYCKDQHLPITIIRPATVYGPGELYAWFVAFELFARHKGSLSSGGRNKIHFISVFDVVRAAIHLAEKNEAVGQAYTICDERPYTQKEAIVLMRKAMGVGGPLLNIPKKLFRWLVQYCPPFAQWLGGLTVEVADFYMDSFTFSNKKLKSTGFTYLRPEFKDGLDEAVRWYAENKILPIKPKP